MTADSPEPSALAGRVVSRGADRESTTVRRDGPGRRVEGLEPYG